MQHWLRDRLSSCWQPVQKRYARMNKYAGENDDALQWCRDLVSCACGETSMAIVEANDPGEDCCQLETGSVGTFVGVYDGHGACDAAQFVCEHLYRNLLELVSGTADVSDSLIRGAFKATEEEFEYYVKSRPDLVSSGTCCLVGLIRGDILYVANLGDSRAVLGSISHRTGEIKSTQITADDNVNVEEVRQTLRAMHPDDEEIVTFERGSWRVKGIIQITKSIGDFYLKKSDVNKEELSEKFKLARPLERPILSAEPTIKVWKFEQHHRFIIFASDGLWERLSNERACQIVFNGPRSGIARRLIREAIDVSVKSYLKQHKQIMNVNKRTRRYIHDDITVIVVFIDHGKEASVSDVSIKGGIVETIHTQ